MLSSRKQDCPCWCNFIWITEKRCLWTKSGVSKILCEGPDSTSCSHVSHEVYGVTTQLWKWWKWLCLNKTLFMDFKKIIKCRRTCTWPTQYLSNPQLHQHHLKDQGAQSQLIPWPVTSHAGTFLPSFLASHSPKFCPWWVLHSELGEAVTEEEWKKSTQPSSNANAGGCPDRSWGV